MEFILQAKENYSNLAQIHIEDEHKYYKVTFDNNIYGERQTMDEFENHVIELMQVKTR